MAAPDVSTKAREALGYFEKAARTTGAWFWRVRDGAPAWVTELCFAAHGHGAMLPDDWRYAFLVQALVALDEGGELEPSIYTSELCAWLASNVHRPGYVDEAREDFGPGKSVLDDLQRGQLAEMYEVLEQAAAFLDGLAEEEGDDAGDEA